jgi:hypothetical protein
MQTAIGDSLSDGANSDVDENGEDDEDTELGNLSEDDDEPGWGMGTILKMVPLRIERFWEQQMTLDQPTLPEWGNLTYNLHERVLKYGTTKFKVPAVGKPHTDDNTATPSPTGYTELLESLHIIPGISHMPQRTSLAGSSHMRLGFKISQSNKCIALRLPNVEPDLSPIENAKPI